MTSDPAHSKVPSHEAPSIHASAVCVGDHAVLIRGASGTGKSRLAFELILAGRAGQLPPAILIGDDRVYLERRSGDLVVRPAPQLAGLLEIPGLGIRRCDFMPEATVGLVVDLAADDAARLPAPQSLGTSLLGIALPRIPVERGFHALPLIAGHLITIIGYMEGSVPDDCQKRFGNHISPTIATK